MGETTKIQWCDYSWSPWWGCTPVSPGCANCYAAQWAKFTRGLEYKRGTPEGEKAWREWYDENLRLCDIAQRQAREALCKVHGVVF